MNTSTPSTGLRGLIATAIFGALASSFSAVSVADPSSASITVKYADLNVASRSGALGFMSEQPSGSGGSACNYFVRDRARLNLAAVPNTIASAVSKANRPALSAVYEAKFKISAPSRLVSQSR